jgi:hypothetical protein
MSGNPTIEQRLTALEQTLSGHAAQIGQLVAGNTPKISTKTAGLLTAIVAVLTGLASSAALPPEASVGVTALITGITAYVAAEQT